MKIFDFFKKREEAPTEAPTGNVNDVLLTPQEKIMKLINRNGYIFNVDVDITTDDNKYHTRIAGIVNNHLITLDRNIIDIRDVKDIIIYN